MRQFVRQLWQSSAPLTFVCLLMLFDALLAAVGLAFDPRVVTGALVWLKPLKFGISTAIYTGTLAWFCGFATASRQRIQRTEMVISCFLVIEVVLIDVQAARGVPSHFNAGTRLDLIVFNAMGGVIGIVWVASAFLATVLFRQKFGDAALGWAIRLGFVISLLGAACGGLMLLPKGDQMAQIRHGRMPASVGGHTVGAPDGGQGIPGLGWSLDHGDLRIPHFIGLHAAQTIPFLAWLVRRRRIGVGAVFGIAGCYLGLIGILTWQAYRGQSVIHPDAITLDALGLWLALAMTVALTAWRSPSRLHMAA
jgi:hypothetical protein